MEDTIMLPSNSPDNNIKTMVGEVDGGLEKGNFQVKKWVLSGQETKIPVLYMLKVTHSQLRQKLIGLLEKGV